MSDSKAHRWNRIFSKKGRTVIFAMDHAASFGMMEGLEKPGEVITKVQAGGADAILTNVGVVKTFAKEIGNMSICLRVDGGSTTLSPERNHSTLVFNVYEALRLGAEAVCCMGMPGSSYEADNLPYLADLISQGMEWGVPIMAEMLPGGFEDPAKWWTPENIGHACRIGVEMGVDFVKTTYSGDPESWKKIVEQTYAPIVVLGGGKSKDPADLLTSIYDAVNAGAAGVAVGRNIYRHPHPDKLTAAIVAIVHEDATVEKALEYLK